MSNNKQSSVDWLAENIPDLSKYIPFGVSMELHAKFQQAKAMHKEEQATTWLDSRLEDKGDNYIGKQKSFEQYYNETFGDN